jgi:hypothetical protein
MSTNATLTTAILLALCAASARAEGAAPATATPYGSVATASIAKPSKYPVRLPAEAAIVQADKGSGTCLLTLETLEGTTFQSGADNAVCDAFASARGSLMNLTYTLLEEPAEPYAAIPGIHQHWLIIEGSKAAAPEGTLCKSGERALFSCMLPDRAFSACASGASSGVFGGKVLIREQISGQAREEFFSASQISAGFSNHGTGRGAWARFSRRDGSTAIAFAGSAPWDAASTAPVPLQGLQTTTPGAAPAVSKCLGLATGELGQDWIEHAKIARDAAPFDFPR